MNSPARGTFITFEGIDGTGKSTQIRLLARWLRQRGYSVCTTREPGGTRAGERIRRLLLGSREAVTPFAELLMMYAARSQHLEEIIRPALARGEIVVSDRYNDSSFAYQGFGRGLGQDSVRLLDGLICGRTQPHLTIVLDASAPTGLSRAARRSRSRPLQRFEADGAAFQDRVRRGYLAMARKNPSRMKVVEAAQPVAAVQADIRQIVGTFLSARRVRPSAKKRTA